MIYKDMIEGLAAHYSGPDAVPADLEARAILQYCREHDALDEGLFDNDGMHPDPTTGIGLCAQIAEAGDDADLLQLARRLQFRLRENLREYAPIDVDWHEATDEQGPQSFKEFFWQESA